MISSSDPDIFDPPQQLSWKKCKFTNEEDQKLLHFVQEFGSKNWKEIANRMPGRSIRQCRERYKYFLSPESSNRNSWSFEEDNLLIQKHQEIGPHWSKIVPYFTGRSDVSLKNRFHLLMRGVNKAITSTSINTSTKIQRKIYELPIPISVLAALLEEVKQECKSGEIV
ncbi:Myb-like DNA-binding domain containing protein [Tritrichomonas foetus]|uniref:Myb-like DNA-binding domain containing protein n=1 Tax=Tritrichomonas foetus TaxID=1144522 RepID=A0A1J4KTV9_9EUKA|nr:Myb-like DNA-binding domain containing protein [Tritrichomonas foetus]|eukprot:OHT14721.1 Myb-like DNA-binding domain containing protein [Tritrichomonas foetus]